jgi:hypothetical protein
MKTLSVAAGLALACAVPLAAHAEKLKVKLSGFQETPLTLSSPGSAEFEAQIKGKGDDATIEWTLSYQDLPTTVQQAHIHFGARAITGGISIFLCTNLGNGPAGTQACPASPATITGVIDAADVIGPAGQGIAAGELAEIIAAIRAGVAYVNVHTVQFPGGEIRGQFRRHHGERDHHGDGDDHRH